MMRYVLAIFAVLLIASEVRAQDASKERPPSAIDTLAAGEVSTPAAPSGVFSQSLQTFTGYESLNSTAARQPVDAVVVSRLVKQRLGQVQSEALRDAFRSIIPHENAAAGDVLDSVVALVVDLSDAETHSQNLLAALSRSSAAVAMSVLVPDPGGCVCAGDADGKLCDARIEAAYEGLSQSARLKVVGFPFADGKITGGDALQSKCRNYRDGITVLVDTALFGLPLNEFKARGGAQPVFDDVLANARGLAKDCSAVTGFNEASSEIDLTSLSTVELSGLSRYADALQGLTPPPGHECQKGLRVFRNALMKSGLPAAAQHFSEISAPRLDALVATINQGQGLLANSTTGYPLEAALLPLRRLVDGGRLRRGEVLGLLGEVKRVLDSAPTYTKSKVVKPVVDAVFEELPHAVREDANTRVGVRLDVTSLGSRMVARYADTTREGTYLRATVGVGYLSIPGLEGDSALRPLVYEEVGVGYRWSTASGRLLIGPHLAASGILNQFVLEESTGNGVLGLVGISANIYKLIDISVNASYLFASTQFNNQFGVVVGLQIPLQDYIGALASLGSVEGN